MFCRLAQQQLPAAVSVCAADSVPGPLIGKPAHRSNRGWPVLSCSTSVHRRRVRTRTRQTRTTPAGRWMEALLDANSTLTHFVAFVSVTPCPTCLVRLHLQLAACSRRCLTGVARALHLLVWSTVGRGCGTQSRVRQSCGNVLGVALSRRFFLAQVLLNQIDLARQRQRSLPHIRLADASTLGHPRVAASSAGHTDAPVKEQCVTACAHCRDPLRDLVPLFGPPAEFAHAHIRVRPRRVLVVCSACLRSFEYLWWEWQLEQSRQLRLIVTLVKPWVVPVKPWVAPGRIMLLRQ